MHRVSDIVEFILKYRKQSPAFENYTVAQLAQEITDKAESGELFYSVDEQENVDGVAIVELNGTVIHVHNVVVSKNKLGLKLIDCILTKYTTATVLEANHHRKPVRYELTDNVKRKIKVYGQR